MTPSDAPRQENEARFGAARDGVAVLDPDWRIRYANASLLEILRLIGRGGAVATLWDALPGWEATPEADRLREAMATGKPTRFRVDGARGNGRVWEVDAEPLPTGELRLRLRNVTAQAREEDAERVARQAHAALAEREARLAAIVEGAPVGIVLLEADTWRVREANDFYHRFLDGKWRRPGSIVGHAFPEFLPDFESAGVAEIFERVRTTGEPLEIPEFEFRGFERGTTWFRWTLKPLPEGDGAPRYLLLLVVEITEEVRARRAAEAERRALYDVLSTLPVGVLVAEAPSGRTIYLNPAGAALGGRSRQELLADEVGEYTDRWRAFRPTGEPYAPHELQIARAVAGDATRDQEVVLRLPDGRERTMLVSGVPIRDATGAVDRGMVVFYDITERLALERALVERTREAENAASEAALRAEESRALREIARALVSEPEPDRVLRMAVRAALELLGARGASVYIPRPDGERFHVGPALGMLAEMDGRDFTVEGSVLQRVMADDRAFLFNSLDEVPATSPALPQMRALGVRGLLFVPMRAFGRLLGVMNAVNRDGGFTPEHEALLQALADSAALAVHNAKVLADERRRAEESRALLAAAEALASTLDPDAVMERIAQVATELAHADGAGVTMFTDESRERTTMAAAVGVLAPFRGVASPARGTLSGEVAAAGVPRRVRTSQLPGHPSAEALRALGVEHDAMVPLRAGDDVVGVLGVVRGPEAEPFDDEDVRMLSLLAGQAAQAVRNARLYSAAQVASRAKTDFMAMMSHELRTPLNALEGYAALLEDGIYGEINEAQARALGRMRVARRHLMALIDQVLDLARVESGARHVEIEPVDVDELVEQTAESLRGAAAARGLAYRVETGGAGTTRTDPGMLRQILTNLVGNAAKFTDRGEVVVRVRREEGRVVLEVSDTGPGIPPEHLERIFEAFYQVDPSTTRKEGGSGLGLALSREFARLLGGDLSVRSAPGEGSTFTVWLPG
ncbi:MAG TPA: ATP-binding protein [Longimicrobium sp.]|nr:ATP-binding protein [Longimicrobium sp.]